MKFSDQQLSAYESFSNGESVFCDPESIAIKLTGTDRAKFLHNFCTADINQLESGDSTEAFILNAKGKTIAFVLVLASEDSLILVVQSSQAPQILDHLNKYAFLEDARLELLENIQIVWSLHTSNSGHTTNLASQLSVELVEDGSTDLASVDKEIFDSYRIENRIPISGVDVLEDNLAQEFERDSTAISFTKGCYLGQETVARLDALGHTNKTLRLIQLKSESVPDLETKLDRDGKPCGTVTSVCWSPKFGSYLAMAMVKKPNHKLGTELGWGDEKVEVVA